ncbi:cytochrome P450 [Nocardia sp. NPDC050406]|uniref:cytochrome P450 n=1 Tax=Nocardia sp. NPDC050406 TaxID=3364318 RepID=UPI0037BB650B
MAETRTIAFDLNDPAVIANPYPHYAWLRDEAPVHHSTTLDVWLLSRHDDVAMALRDSTRFSSDLYAAEDFSNNPFNPGMSLPRWLTRAVQHLPPVRTLLTSDPPQHTRLRKKVSRAFAPRRIAALEPRIRDITERLVDDLLAHGKGGATDVTRDLAQPLPTLVIAELMGIPSQRRADFQRWSDGLVNGLLTGGDLRRMMVSAIRILAYFTRVVRQRRRRPGDDLISLLITPDADGTLSTVELVNFCILLLIGGHETTTNLISNAVAALLDRPQLWQRLSQDPELAPAAVEETLRYDGPAQSLLRITTTEVTLHGVTIPAGARVLPLLGAANRDPRHWDDPENFRLDRNRHDHIAFGIGMHYCIANALARMEGRIALEILARRAPHLTSAGEPVRIPSPVLRGLRSLPVHIGT